ncbi:Coilin Sphere organelles protein SPH-1 [Collichthys lucidus]|uniref:Coilin Sphere organelles protein SPH-1 n=1 Tax=Collichthys lucidus TaxID=240159 RepID=A0A4U5VVF7_COLLU|nr:Coilin Sphere organelles protein SPH-1 [Collichthys lucidus]
MAAHGNNFIRVRLYFDYPPPAVVDCRMCWLLVDLNTCRVVADLESLIRNKFEFSRGSILSLFIEDCYLPHTESVHVVRDNDSVRVKVDSLALVNGNCPDRASDKSRKRQRPTEEDGVSVEWEKKKRKKGSKEAKQASGDGRKLEQPAKTTEKPPQKVSSSDSSSSSEEDEPPKKVKPAPKKVIPAPKAPSSTPAASKTPPATKPAQTKTRPPSSSSSDSSSSSSEEEEEPPKKVKPAPKKVKPAPKAPSSTPAASKTPKPCSPSSSSETSSDEATGVKIPPKTKPPMSTVPTRRIDDGSESQQASPALQPTNCAQKPPPPRDKPAEPCSSSSEEEIQLVIRKPAVQQLGHGEGNQASWRGRGRGRGQPRHGDPGERGRGEGRGGNRGHNGNFKFSYNGAMEPSYQTDSLSNVSLVIQNGAESAPKQDYSTMPLLAAPPQVGQRIAFKLLELTENYTPEVSEYKEGRIVSFDHTTKQIELELNNGSQAPVEPGKFDLVYQNPDGTESVEYAVSRSSRVTERWDSLLEPRLIL